MIWDESGLLTVTGGKLTTFQAMAHDALRAVRHRLPAPRHKERGVRVLNEVSLGPLDSTRLPSTTRLRLLGRYGHDAGNLLEDATMNDHRTIGDSPYLWSELRWAARGEAVVHLEDLLLRRVRIGLTLPKGGVAMLDQIRDIAQPELGWTDDRWKHEAHAYEALWRSSYAPRH